jgi:hypothetical protein
VRRTKTRHFQTDTEESWPGWDDQRLIAVMRHKAALDAPVAKPPNPGPSGPPAPPPVHADGPSPAEEGTMGTFRVAGQPTAVRLTFRVGRGLDASEMDYAVAVAARSLADGQCHPLAPADGTAATGRPVTLKLADQPLPPGIHRLEATVTVYSHRHQPGDPPLAQHHVLGDLVHVAAHKTSGPLHCRGLSAPDSATNRPQ